MIMAEEGYTIGEISIEPQELNVAGSKSALSEIDKIEIPAEELEISGLTQGAEETVDVIPYLPDEITLVDENANNIVVTIDVEQPGTETYEVSTSSIMVNNLSDDLELGYGTTVDLTVQIRGPSDILRKFSIAKKVSIDLKDYTEAGIYNVPVKVDLPDGCTLVDDLTVEVVLEDISDAAGDDGTTDKNE